MLTRNKKVLQYIDPTRFAAEQKADAKSKWIAIVVVIILGLLAVIFNH